jgi:transposase
VAAALAIHPFMLSKWRKEVRDGRLTGRARTARPHAPARELARLQQLERDYALLKEEHDLLKKAIRFCSARSATPLRSSKRNARASA